MHRSLNGGGHRSHIKVRRKDRADTSPISDDEIESLKEVSKQFSAIYGVPVPLSYNQNRNQTDDDGQGHQRFFNLRFRSQGLESIKAKVKAVEEGIVQHTQFAVVKTISEYVWYDTYNAMDQGWIDFDPSEQRVQSQQ